MYDLTGQKIGTAFVGDDGKEDVVMVRRGHALRWRQFVGAVQPSWGLGEAPIIKDLQPTPTRNSITSGKRVREYIGNRAILSFPLFSSARADPADVEDSGIADAGVDGHAAPERDIDMAFDGAIADVGGGRAFYFDVEDFNDGASPLSSLDDGSCDEGGEGECRQWPFVHESDLGIAAQGGLDWFLEKGPGVGFSPDSLEDFDVVRAITLGLRACGVVVQI
jgi:hypothetical protein